MPDPEQPQKPQDEANIVLINPKNPINVAAVLRASGCYRVEKLYSTGRRYPQALQHQQGHGQLKHVDTNNAQAHIASIGLADIAELPRAEHAMVCVELVEGATALPQFVHPPRAHYLFGPEDGSIPQSVIDQADAVVYVPTHGCMNLAATVNVLLYDRLAKSAAASGSDAQIRASRDNNNRLKLKP